MNEQLIKFIELCLVDGIITDKEREIIFRKSKELGVPNDECEIILEGMIGQLRNRTSSEHREPKQNKEKKDNNDLLEVQNDFVHTIQESLSSLSDELLSNGELKEQFLSKDFIKWFQDLPNHLQRYRSMGCTEIRDSRWDEFETFPLTIDFWETYIEGDVSHVLSDSFNKKVLSISNRLSDNPILITTDGIYKCVKEYKSGGLFNKERYIYSNFKLIKKISDIDIFNDDDIQHIGGFIEFFISHHYRQYDIDTMVSKMETLNFNKEEVLIYLRQDSDYNKDVIKLNFEISRLVNVYNDYIRGNRFTTNLNEPGVTHRYKLSFVEYQYRKYKYMWEENKVGVEILNTIESQLKMISNLLVLRNQMILLIQEGKNNDIESIKVELDELGLLMNKFERESISKLDELLDTIKGGFMMMKMMMDRLNNSINKLDRNISELGDSLRVQNMLLVINSIQLNKINKNTK